MTQPPPFQQFAGLLSADPYELAAGGLDLFLQRPKLPQASVQTWLRSLVATKGATFFGSYLSEPVELEAAEYRTLLIWERAMVVARVVENLRTYGTTTATYDLNYVLLLRPEVLAWSFPGRAHLLRRACGDIDDLR